jgi:hypothetical protein
MRCAAGVAVLWLIASDPASALEDRTDAQALTLRLTFPDRVAVRLGLGLALQRLDRPGCSAIYDEFQLPDGCTPRCELDRRRIGPRELLKTLVFADGSGDPVCYNGRALLTTTPGSLLIHVCPGFARVQSRLRASLIIHESLHALGLGENPPSSNEITNRVERRCW